MSKNYYLMLFDTQVAQFAAWWDKFSVPQFNNVVIYNESLLPFGFKSIKEWLENRKAPKHRENVDKLLSASGIKDILGYIEVSYALTLTDSYWVKPTKSSLSFKDVNLYDNKFNNTVALMAFNGSGIAGRNLKSTSPEYSTDGALAKCWIRKDGKIYLYKRGTSGAKNAGKEPYSEYYACQVAEAMGIEDYIFYNLKKFKGNLVSVCELFTNKDTGYVSAGQLDLKLDPGSLLRAFQEIGQGDFFRQMVIFDGIILNEDRHLGNFGFLFNNHTRQIIKNAPIFDNGVSLLPYMMEDNYDDLEEYILQKGPRIGVDFVETARALLSSKEKQMVRRLLNFRFKKHPSYNLDDKRLNILSKVVRNQVSKILS